MDSLMLLILCFLALLVPARSGLSKKMVRSADVGVPGVTIDETAVSDFEKVTSLYEDALAARPDLGDLLINVTQEKLIPFKHEHYYHDICPSERVMKRMSNISCGHRCNCWSIPVLYVRCLTKECQYWNCKPWIPNYRFVCREKMVYEYVWSFCITDDTSRGFFKIMRIKIPKSCDCSLTK